MDIAIMSAAVADAKPAVFSKQKLKKTRDEMNRIDLVPTDDILATIGALAKRPLLVGFAAETGSVAKYAREKLVRKKIDLVCANDVSEAGSGFDVDTNRILLVRKGARDRWLPRSSKDEAAERILDEVKLLLGKRK
jgi:phosphopantothenoylcysteine decarboxylase/phosphopantothenate--cysteine ligase